MLICASRTPVLFWLFSLLVVLLLLAAATHAMAATSATTIDVGPAVTSVIGYLATALLAVLTTLAGWAFSLFKSKTGWDIDNSVGAIVDQGLNRAVAFAASKLTNGAAGGIPIDLKSQAIATAAQYAIDKLPDALAHFGIDSAGHPKLAEMIEARLDEWLGITPPAATTQASIPLTSTAAAS